MFLAAVVLLLLFLTVFFQSFRTITCVVSLLGIVQAYKHVLLSLLRIFVML